MAYQAGAYPAFLSRKRLRVFLLPPGWDASPLQRHFPSIKFAGTHNLYTWMERGTVRVRCLTQEHNTMSPARARTRTARSGDKRTNHEATLPPYLHSVSFITYMQPGLVDLKRVESFDLSLFIL